MTKKQPITKWNKFMLVATFLGVAAFSKAYSLKNIKSLIGFF
jgi:hypothetical protein